MNAKRQRFCEEYMKDLNGKEAAIRAGYAKKHAAFEASKLLAIPEISEYVTQLKKETSKRNNITVDELIQDLAEIKNINVADLYDENGLLKDLHQLPREFTKCINEITETKSIWGKEGENEKTVRKVKFYSRLDAIEKLAKHLGFYEKDNKQQSELKFKIEIVDADKDETE